MSISGLGCGGCKRSLHLRTCWMLRKMLGWGGGDVNVPCTCTHAGCYARCWVGVGGMLTLGRPWKKFTTPGKKLRVSPPLTPGKKT